MSSKSTQLASTAQLRPLLLPALQETEFDSERGFFPLPVREREKNPVLVAMDSPLVAMIYERWWRPGFGRILKGVSGPSMADEYTIAAELMDIQKGNTVLDLACGPGNFTRRFSALVGDGGLAVGFDASETMLERAHRDNDAAGISNIALVRGDASVLPFGDATFDSVCCYAALHMFPDPMLTLDEIARVLKPGGRVTLLTSCRPNGPEVVGQISKAISDASGQTMFGRNQITGELQDRGFLITKQIVGGLHQTLGAKLSA